MREPNNSNYLKKYTCVILCGGQSLRMRFDLPNQSKLLATINDNPLLHHVLDYYCSSGLFNKFVLCLGGEGDVIRESFNSSPNYDKAKWRGIELVMIETGVRATATSRIFQTLAYVDDNLFFLTYGDVISNVNFGNMLKLHSNKSSDITMATVKAKMPYGRVLVNDDGEVYNFVEKPVLEHWINAGYFILSRSSISKEDVDMEFESEFLPEFLKKESKKITAYKHNDYWKGIDTYKDLIELRNEWNTLKATKLFPIPEELQ